MADINHVVVVGRLTRDAELKYTNTGTAICKVSVAVNRRRKVDEQWTEEANFFDVTIWGKMGEAIAQYLVKGKQIGVEGELRQSKWEQDGQTRSKVEIVANNVQLLGGKMGDRQGTARAGSDDAPNGAAKVPKDNFEDDIPF
jgi:single-strand DNA-binding protein